LPMSGSDGVVPVNASFESPTVIPIEDQRILDEISSHERILKVCSLNTLLGLYI
jgi:hypothetical protein